jgi:hypothetical protein
MSASTATMMQGMDAEAGEDFNASATAKANTPDVNQNAVRANSEACRILAVNKKKPCAASPIEQAAAKPIKTDAIRVAIVGRWLETRQSTAARHSSKTIAQATSSIAGLRVGD